MIQWYHRLLNYWCYITGLPVTFPFSVCFCGVCFGLFCLRVFCLVVFFGFWFVTESWRPFGLCIGPPPVHFWGHSISRRPHLCVNSLIHLSLQHAIERVERPGESQEASDEKKSKSGREICVSSLLACFFSLCWFFHELPRLWSQSVSYFLHTFLSLLSLSGPSLRARSAATEEKKASTILNWGGPFLLPAFSYLRSKSLEVLPRYFVSFPCSLFFRPTPDGSRQVVYSSRKDNCIVQIHRINAIATLVIMTMCVSFPCSRDTGVRDLVSNLFHPIFFVLLNFPRPWGLEACLEAIVFVMALWLPSRTV